MSKDVTYKVQLIYHKDMQHPIDKMLTPDEKEAEKYFDCLTVKDQGFKQNGHYIIRMIRIIRSDKFINPSVSNMYEFDTKAQLNVGL